jgi:hypothetical protein
MGACAPCCVWALNDVRGSPRWLRWMSLIFSATSSERRMAEANLRSPLFRPSEETR